MNEDVYYESETDDKRLISGWIAAFATTILIVYCERWVWEITAFAPTGVFVWLSGSVFVLLGLLLFFLIRYLLLSRPKLTLSKDNLSVGQEIIAFKDIKDLEIDVRKFLRWSRPEELVIIKLNSGQIIPIVVSRYSNGYLFRTFCEKIKEDIGTGKFEVNTVTPTDVVLNPIPFSDLGNETFKEFRPGPFASMAFYHSLLTFMAGILVLSIPVKDAGYSFNIGMSIFLFALFFGAVTLQKYFLVSDKYLVIKYYLYFWKATVIRIADIRKIEILRAGRSAKLSIMTKDYKIHSFIIDTVTFSKKTDEMIDAVNNYAGINPKTE